MCIRDRLSEQDAIVRTAAARELQMRGGRDIFEKVQHLSGNENPETREIAAFILGQIGTPKMPVSYTHLDRHWIWGQ